MRMRSALITVAAFAVAGYIFKRINDSSKFKAAEIEEGYRRQSEAVDGSSDDSFPASDPPAWTGGHYH